MSFNFLDFIFGLFSVGGVFSFSTDVLFLKLLTLNLQQYA